MPKITYIDSAGGQRTIDVQKGLSVMEGAIQNNIPGIDADCGGSMACATCHVYVKDEWFDKINKKKKEVLIKGMQFHKLIKNSHPFFTSSKTKLGVKDIKKQIVDNLKNHE